MKKDGVECWRVSKLHIAFGEEALSVASPFSFGDLNQETTPATTKPSTRKLHFRPRTGPGPGSISSS